jgi:ferredoxin-NADP reductase
LPRHITTVTDHRRLDASTFEVRLTRPPGFAFLPGRKTRFYLGITERDYTLVGPADEGDLAICVRRVAGGVSAAVLDMVLIFGLHHAIFDPCKDQSILRKGAFS